MERYERYKDSGVKWIGGIPGHWGMYKLKYLFKLNKNKNIGNKCNTILSLSYGKIKIKKDLNEGLTPESYESYQLLSTGDIVIRSTDLQNDHTSLRTGLVKIEGAITSAYIGLKNLDMSLCDSRFYHYFLHDWDITKAIYNQGKGLRQSLNWDDIKNMLIPVLDISEQTAIANYLDSTTAKIDEAIAQQQKMINLLNERKQIIINNAVTKGLNPDAPMKDSGVDYIGLIPEHWVVRRMASLGVFSKGGGISRDNLLEEGEPAILYGDIYTKYNYFAEDIKNHVSKKVALASVEVHKNELLMTGSGETKEDIGKTIVFLGNKAYAGGDVIIFKQDNNNSSFLSYALNSSYAKNFRYKESKGEIVVHIYANAVRQLYLALPDITEQNSIVEYLNNKVGIIDSEICVVRKQISLLQERKQIIINDVVTGKVKVS